MKVFLWIAGAVTAIFKFLDLRLKYKEKHEKERKEKEISDLVDKAKGDVVHGNGDDLNRIISEVGQEKRLKQAGAILQSVCLVLSIVGLFLIAAVSGGCITKTVVVPADRQVVRMELDSIEGWFVPDALMADFMESYIRTRQIEQIEGELSQ